MSTTTFKPDRLFRAVSDKTRLRILNLLAADERCVCDIVAVLQIPQPTASRHLAYLRKAGLVSVRKDGVWSYYRLAAPANEFVANLLKCVECCSTLPRIAKDRDRLKIIDSNCCE